ncbi:MAG TPA: SRPBCC family protein [Dermatophilaceae bacterium]|nr:SRPBCC family protein [Dermatophilaceae bacterium]
MGTFAIERVVAAPPSQVWGVVTDWAGYARWMPLTTMRLDRGPTGVGWSFAGLTGVGRLRFSDVMRITNWAPPSEEGPGSFRLVKVGHLLAGWAEVNVLPIAGGEQTQLQWREDIVIRPILLGRLLAPLTDRFNKVLFTKVVNAMALEATHAPRASDPGQNASGR